MASKDVARFDELICESMGYVFTSSGWELWLPLQIDSLATGGPVGGQTRLMNLWGIPNFSSLALVMAKALDNNAYVDANKLVNVEAQTLFVPLRYDSPIGDAPEEASDGSRLGWTPELQRLHAEHQNRSCGGEERTEGSDDQRGVDEGSKAVAEQRPQHRDSDCHPAYLVERLSMTKDTMLLNDYMNYMSNAVYDMNWKFKWRIQLGGTASTGKLNEYVNIWGIADMANFDEALAAYRGNSAWSSAVEYLDSSIWRLRDVPCFDTSTDSSS